MSRFPGAGGYIIWQRIIQDRRRAVPVSRLRLFCTVSLLISHYQRSHTLAHLDMFLAYLEKRETEERGRRETVRELTEIKNTRCNVASTNMNEQERTHEATLSKSACAWAWLKGAAGRGWGVRRPRVVGGNYAKREGA